MKKEDIFYECNVICDTDPIQCRIFVFDKKDRALFKETLNNLKREANTSFIRDVQFYLDKELELYVIRVWHYSHWSCQMTEEMFDQFNDAAYSREVRKMVDAPIGGKDESTCSA